MPASEGVREASGTGVGCIAMGACVNPDSIMASKPVPIVLVGIQ
jgi:hypothetical protein